jgi:hypothetical protein
MTNQPATLHLKLTAELQDAIEKYHTLSDLDTVAAHAGIDVDVLADARHAAASQIAHAAVQALALHKCHSRHLDTTIVSEVYDGLR